MNVRADHMPRKQPAFDLKILNRVAQALAETNDLKEVKSLRDKAEAASQYIANARLGQNLQNLAAAVKLRAERRIGQLLRELIPHGGNRRSSRHHADLKLSDLGIDSSQSSRWRREAAVPEAVFEQYLTLANKLGQDITARGLLRLARTMTNGRTSDQRTEFGCAQSSDTPVPCDVDVSDLLYRNREKGSTCASDASEARIHELLTEMSNHRDLLAGILAPICDGRCDLTLLLSQRHIIARLLSDIQSLIRRIERMWFADEGNREG